MTKLPIHMAPAKRVSQSKIEQEEDHTAEGGEAPEDATAAPTETLADATPKEAEVMDAESLAPTPPSQVAGKRTREQTVEEKLDASSDGGPPPKTVSARRAATRPRSIVPMEVRLAGKPPP
ncbi:hypothetical protein MTO96_048716 [Rhipicephalus appendiculatus]